MARGVNDVDVMLAVLERRILGLDGDALLALEIHGIHDSFLLRNRLIRAERAGLLEQTIHERGLPVIHVRNNGNVSNVLHAIPLPESRALCMEFVLKQEKGRRLPSLWRDNAWTTSRPIAPLPRADRGRRN